MADRQPTAVPTKRGTAFKRAEMCSQGRPACTLRIARNACLHTPSGVCRYTVTGVRVCNFTVKCKLRVNYSCKTVIAPMAEQQTLITNQGGRVGLARSRNEVDGSENALKKQKVDKNWVTQQVSEQNGQLICKHCGDGVSKTNITRRKEHLLKCKSFLGSQAGETAAGSDSKLKDALEAYKFRSDHGLPSTCLRCATVALLTSTCLLCAGSSSSSRHRLRTSSSSAPCCSPC